MFCVHIALAHLQKSRLTIPSLCLRYSLSHRYPPCHRVSLLVPRALTIVLYITSVYALLSILAATRALDSVYCITALNDNDTRGDHSCVW